MFVLAHDGRFGYTANVGPGTVSVLDMEKHTLLGTVPVAPHIQRIAISNDDKTVYVSDTTTPRLMAVDTASRSVRGSVEMPATGYGASALHNANAVGVIDLRAMKLVKSIPVAGKPQEVLLSPDGSRAWASAFGVPEVAEIDTASFTVTRELPAGKQNDGLAWTPLQ